MIPATAHFIWFGESFPWANVLAISSAARCGEFKRLILHSDRDLSGTRHWKNLEALEGFESRRLDIDSVFDAVGERGEGLKKIFEKLTQPAGRANVVRAAILSAEGGVYLDTDTITTASLTPMRMNSGAFCGRERIVLPYEVKSSNSMGVWLGAGVKLLLRDLFRRLPGGWRGFRKIEGYYAMAANNAVMGCEAGHPFVTDMLDRMIATPLERQQVRFALGTHLLQQALKGEATRDVKCYEPRVFYPLGPEISEHWFKKTDARMLDEVLLPETRVVHWYASVRTKAIIPQLDEEYIKRNRRKQMFSALACRVLGV